MKQNAEDIAQEVYRETAAFYTEKIPNLGDAACGFRILYGPPNHKVPTLFIGYQPGGDCKDIVEEQHLKWPTECEYAKQEWKLARQMREIWSDSELSHSTGLNVLFFRARNEKSWKSVPLSLRKELEEFCHKNAIKLISVLEPRQIVFIGLSVFKQYVPSSFDVLNGEGNNRPLIRKGRFLDIPAYGVIHLSGARIRKSHKNAIRDFFNPQISN